MSQFEAGATEAVPWAMLEAYLELASLNGIGAAWALAISAEPLDRPTRLPREDVRRAVEGGCGNVVWRAVEEVLVRAGIIAPASPADPTAAGSGAMSILQAARAGVFHAPGPEPVRPPPDAPVWRPPVLVEPGFEVLDPEQLPTDWHGRYVPIIGRVAAGTQFAFDTARADSLPAGVADSYVRCERAPARAFAVEVRGDSMAPRFDHGDIVVADPDTRVASGVCVAVETQRSGDRVPRLKVLRLHGRLCELASLNTKYQPIRAAASSVEAFAVWRHLPWKRETRAT